MLVDLWYLLCISGFNLGIMWMLDALHIWFRCSHVLLEMVAEVRAVRFLAPPAYQLSSVSGRSFAVVSCQQSFVVY